MKAMATNNKYDKSYILFDFVKIKESLMHF